MPRYTKAKSVSCPECGRVFIDCILQDERIPLHWKDVPKQNEEGTIDPNDYKCKGSYEPTEH